MAEDIDKQHRLTKESFSESNHTLAWINGVINRMTKEDLRIQLQLLGLDDRGVKEVLKRRLKSYHKKQKFSKLKHISENNHQLDYYCIIDFEGTCEEKNPDGYIHEIIEFPAILVNGRTLEFEDEFHQYCRPLEKVKLSVFCQNLTGISQETVDAAKPFPLVLRDFNRWLEKHKLGTDRTFAIVTDGPWDLGKFFPEQCVLTGIKPPGYASKWINLRKHYHRFYKLDMNTPVTLEGILEGVGLTFEGRPHSGIDDARNIAKVFVQMVRDGLEARINDDASRHARLRTIQQ